MENIMVESAEVVENKVVEPSETELAGLFYKMVNRRPLIDVIPEAGEPEFWNKNFKDANELTLYSWAKPWKENMAENVKKFGYFNREHSVKVFANELINKPCILLGAGPSLAKNIKFLAEAKNKGIPIMSNHHSLMYLADYGIKPDYVCCLDAGEMWTDYWAFDKLDLTGVPLMIDQTCNYQHIGEYKGPVYFFKSNVPDDTVCGKFVNMELNRLLTPDKYGSLIEVGGHVLGAMMSLARGVMKADTLIFVGCDYCFEQEKFYPFDKQIDKTVDGKYFDAPGKELPAPPPIQGMIYDIFGNMVGTNGSYLGFKNVMDIGIKTNALVALQANDSLEFINASEGGALGALKSGNSRWMKYMRLEEAIIYASEKVKNKEVKS